MDLAHPQFREQLGVALDEIRKTDLIDRAKVTQQKRIAALEPVLAKMQTRLGLSQPQVTQMRTALESKMERDADLTRRWEEGEDRESLGQVKTENRLAHQTELERILTPTQLELHRERRGGK